MKEPESKRILVVDDEKVVCNSCRKVLELEGYDVRTAMSGREGIEKASQGQFDAAIVDLRMPETGGMDVLRELKSSRPETRVIIITAYSSLATAAEARRLGAADYLAKPFTPRELIDRLTRVLNALDKTPPPQGKKEECSRERKAPADMKEAAKDTSAEARVLIAGSDARQTMTICQSLFSGPWQVTTAKTHEDVIEKVKAGQTDVLITGVDVFGVKACDLIPEIRRTGSEIPVIVASSDSSVELAQRLRVLGIFFYLMEPFDPSEIKAVVHDAVRKAAML